MSGYPSTFDPAVAAVVDAVREAILSVTGPPLVGLYLSSGPRSPATSTPASAALIWSPCSPTPRTSNWLRACAECTRTSPRRDPTGMTASRFIYISKDGLANCRTDTTTIGIISPGESFHLVSAGRDWVLNWYPAREHGVALIGPPIHTLIPPIPTAVYIDELRRYLGHFTNGIDDDATPGTQAYAILSICRGLYTIRHGDRLSKRQAASWAQHAFPQWADLIHRAVGWRDRQRDPDSQDGRTTVQETRAFVTEMAELGFK